MDFLEAFAAEESGDQGLPYWNFSTTDTVEYFDFSKDKLTYRRLHGAEAVDSFLRGSNDTPRDSTRLFVLRTIAPAIGRRWVMRELQLTKETAIRLFRRFARSSAFLSHIFRLGIPSGWRASTKDVENSQNQRQRTELHAWYSVRRTDVYSIFDLQKKNGTFLVVNPDLERLPFLCGKTDFNDGQEVDGYRVADIAAEPFRLHLQFFISATNYWGKMLNERVNNINKREDEAFGGRPVLVPIQAIHKDLRDIERQILKTQHVFQASETLINGFNHYSKLVGLDPDGEVHSDTVGTLEFVKAQAHTLVENYQSARRRLEILVNQYYYLSNDIVAQRTKEIAERTLEDNAVMKQISNESKDIAAQSKAIAEEAKKDSSTMKTLTYVTVVYLPTAVVSSICGTNFIALTSDSSGSHIRVNHSALGAAIAICFALTVFTVLCIWIGNRLGRKKECYLDAGR